MRGTDARSESLFSYVDLEARVPAKHPLRIIKAIVDDALTALDCEFERLYEGTGRQSIAPERLLRASLVQAFYSVRSERQLMEQIDYNLLFRWFVGLGIDDPVWDHSTFSKNRDRLLDADVAAKFLEAVLRHSRVKRFLSDDHFSVDGTLIEAWASLKSFRAKDGSDEPPSPGRNRERDFHGEKRANDTHESTTDPDAKLFRKGNGQPAKLCFMGHALMENRSGLVVQAHFSQASGTAEREAAIHMLDRHSPGSTRRLTLGADKGYDAASFVADLREKCVTPHVAQKVKEKAKPGKTLSRYMRAKNKRFGKVRARVEHVFRVMKCQFGYRKVRYRGIIKNGAQVFSLLALANIYLARKQLAAA